MKKKPRDGIGKPVRDSALFIPNATHKNKRKVRSDGNLDSKYLVEALTLKNKRSRHNAQVEFGGLIQLTAQVGQQLGHQVEGIGGSIVENTHTLFYNVVADTEGDVYSSNNREEISSVSRIIFHALSCENTGFKAPTEGRLNFGRKEFYELIFRDPVKFLMSYPFVYMFEVLDDGHTKLKFHLDQVNFRDQAEFWRTFQRMIWINGSLEFQLGIYDSFNQDCIIRRNLSQSSVEEKLVMKFDVLVFVTAFLVLRSKFIRPFLDSKINYVTSSMIYNQISSIFGSSFYRSQHESSLPTYSTFGLSSIDYSAKSIDRTPWNSILDIEKSHLPPWNSKSLFVHSFARPLLVYELLGVPVVFIQEDQLRLQCDVCAGCGTAGITEFEKMSSCRHCGEVWHRFCLGDSQLCLECVICEICGSDPPDAQLIMCRKCLLWFHVDCLPSSWRCSLDMEFCLCEKCVKCISCESKTSDGPWMFKFSLCQSCGLDRERGNYCVGCNKVCSPYEGTMIACDECSSWIHARCDLIGDSLFQIYCENSNIKYFCPSCRQKCGASLQGLLGPSILTVLTSEDQQKLEKDNHTSKTSFHELLDGTRLIVDDLVPFTESRSYGDHRQCIMCHLRGDSVQKGRLIFLEDLKWAHLGCGDFSHQLKFLQKSNTIERMASDKTATCIQKHSLDISSEFRLSKIQDSHPEKSILEHNRMLKIETPQTCPFPSYPFHLRNHLLTVSNPPTNESTTIQPMRLIRILDRLCHDSTLTLCMGNLILQSIGRITSSRNFHTKNHVYPIGYRVVRRYFDMYSPHLRISYQCEILQSKDDQPLFRVASLANPELVFYGSTCTEAWSPIVKRAREQQRHPGLVEYRRRPYGESLFGLSNKVVRLMIECLHGIQDLDHYRLQSPGRLALRKNTLFESFWSALNPSGCARCEPHMKHLNTYTSRSTDTSMALSSATLKKTILPSENDSSSLNQLDQCNLITQYRNLKSTTNRPRYKISRSAIQGMGLYAVEPFEPHEMVCEYMGEIIGQKVADHREILYESQRIGTYFFKIAEDCILDATRKGNVARFINHSCAPNCYTKCILIDGYKKIIIFTAQRILQGTEFTYDYQLPFEQVKIPCHCGATQCRRTMN